MNTTFLVLLPLAALITGVVLELVFARVLSNRNKGWLAFLCGLAALVSALFLLPAIQQQGAVEFSLLNWDHGIELRYRVDGLSMVFNLMATLIGTAILLYSVAYMEHEDSSARFYAFMLTFIAGLVNLVCAANLLVAYVSWEIIGLCSYFLVGFWYREPAAAQGAKKVLVITHLAGYGFLVGVLLMFVRSGSFNWNDPALQQAFTSGIFALMLISAMAKSVMFPLHTWIPEAMNAPTPVSALLHSACYVKAGVYLIARFYSIHAWQPEWNTVVMVLGAVTMLVGAMFALAQTDMKRLLAYSTISQLGHIITALSLGTPLGIAAGLFYCLSHGLFKGTLFLCAGAVQHSTGTRDMRQLGGLAAKMPATARLWLIAAAAIVGVPLGNGFVAKWLLLDAALDSGQVVIVLVAWVVSVFTAFYMLKATAGVFFGDMPEWLAKKPVHDASPEMKTGMAVLAGLCVLFGVAPQLLIQAVVAPAAKAMGFDQAIQVSWLGVNTSSAGISVTLGAVFVLAALLFGALIFAAARPGKPRETGVFTGGDPLPVEGDLVNASDFTAMVEEAMEPVYRYTDPDPIYLWSWKTLGKAAGALNLAAGQLEARPFVAALVVAAICAVLVLLR